MLKKLLAIILCFVFTVYALPQSAENKNQKETQKEKRAELEKESVAFLRETFKDVANLRTPENRISFNAEMAGLMWFHDEKEARSMFENVITDFKQILIEIDAQTNSIKIRPEDTEFFIIPFIPSSDLQAKLMKKLYKAMGVRQQIALAVSEHDPVLAHEFFIETARVITNPDLRKQIDNRDGNFEMKLLQAIAENDPVKGLEAARKSLAKGLNAQHIELLKKLYAKNAEKGAAFGEDIISKLKSESIDKGDTFYYLKMILSAAVENRSALKDKPNQKPMFDDQGLRDVAEMTAQVLLKSGRVLAEPGSDEVVALIKPFLPARAVQIEQKIALEKKKRAAEKANNEDSDEYRILEEIAEEANTASKSRAEKMQEQTKMMQDLQNLGAKKLPEEERQKVIAQARKLIAEIDEPNMKMLALSSLAAQVAKMGDSETANEILREVERFVNPQPKNYMEYMQTWMLATSYSEINPDKAFALLDDTVFRLNDTISAFIKVGEFIDVNGDFIEDGEVQVGSFGSEITNGLLRELGAADVTLKNLANADFAKTKALTNRFDRTEVRILAKMLVLRAVFGKKQLDDSIESQIVVSEIKAKEQ